MSEIKALCDQVRQVSYDIHVYHGHGHLEKVYENALANRLRKAGLKVEQQHPIKVYDGSLSSLCSLRLQEPCYFIVRRSLPPNRRRFATHRDLFVVERAYRGHNRPFSVA